MLEFIQNYDLNDVVFDISPRQFMQKKDGTLVLLDPLVNKELVKLLWK
jgi:hypothetical protein